MRFENQCSRRPMAMMLSTLVLLTMPTSARGQEETAAPSAGAATNGNPRRESLTHWRYYVEAPLKPAGESPWLDFLVRPTVFDGARLDLADLRLYDADRQEVPYALRVRRKQSELATIDAEEFNRLEEEDGARQVSLDLGAGDIQHNEVEIGATGANFRRKAVVEGSDDREKWHEIATENLLNFHRHGETFIDSTIDYAPSRFRYVRVTVHPDPQSDFQGEWELRSVNVRRRVEVPGEQVTRTLKYQPREPVRTPGGPGSQWLIDLGGAGVPCTELLVKITNSDFVRDWQVEAAGPDRPGENFRFIASGAWQRKAGEKQDTFVAEFPEEVRAARLKLQVTDNRNPPLVILSIQSRAAAREIVLNAKPREPAGPLRLYFGNPDAEEPRYDFARNLPQRLNPPPTRLETGARQTNPNYQPAPEPFTERFPWLVQTVLTLAVAVLGLIVFSLARTAVRQSDQAEQQTKQDQREDL